MKKGVTSQPFRPAGEAFSRVDRIGVRLDDPTAEAPRVVVVGAGRSGIAAVELLRTKHAKVVLADDRADALDAARARFEGLEAAPLADAGTASADLVVLSPGVPRAHPALEAAIAAGLVVGEVELASWFVHVPMVGITGTNGKSTTTALVAHMLEQAHPGAVFAGGNLGRPLSELALAPEGVEVAAVELSSYQLESIVQAKFKVACWLNLTPDHTDRYESIEAYAAAKRRLIERRAVDGAAVLNAKDTRCSKAGLKLGGPVRWFSTSSTSDLAGTMGTRLVSPDEAERVEARSSVQRYRLDNPALIGEHNRANAMAAIECGRLMDLSPEQVQAGLSTFGGLPHRLERLAEIDGVEWRNDSKATNVDSAVTALNALERPILLIAGGRDKGAPWGPLVEAARGRVRHVFAIGEAQGLVVGAFAGSGIESERVGDLDTAVAKARAMAEAGDVVLLSPACASFDQFPNFEARGDHFRALVERGGEA